MKQNKTYKRNDNDVYNCIVTYPDDFNPKSDQTLPMIVFLHGMGERGNDVEKVCIHGIPKLFSKDCTYKNLRVITVSPQCPDNETWAKYPDDIMTFIDNAADDLGADKSKISLTGLSMGGFGTFAVGAKYADRFTHLAPICGGGSVRHAKKYKNIPMRIFHGDADTVVKPENSIKMYDAIKQYSDSVELIMYEGVDHNSWDRAYEKSDLIEWLVK